MQEFEFGLLTRIKTILKAVWYKCYVAFIPVYSRDRAQAMVEIIPARVIIVEHTSYYAALAVGDRFSRSNGKGKTFVVMQARPYNP